MSSPFYRLIPKILVVLSFVLFALLFGFAERREGKIITREANSPILSALPTSSPTQPAVLAEQQEAWVFVPVIRVVDGDTITILIGGKRETVRLIGINTPETVDPRRPVECFGKEASNKAKELLTGKRVRLEADPTQQDRDRYGRLLRYVYLEDGTFVNEWMIEEGFAYEFTYTAPYQYQEEFKTAQEEAMKKQKGLWREGVCG